MPAMTYKRQGALFQLPMIALWMLRWYLYHQSKIEQATSQHIVYSYVQYVGIAIMAVSFVRLYVLRAVQTKLITTDLFAITRHPMYHGMFIADASLFFAHHLHEPVFWTSWLIFVFLLFVAGWYQEKETLARWGDHAQAYYKRSPRFVFEWIWR